MKVIDFPKPDRDNILWVCNCGCVSWNVFEDGHLQCANCDQSLAFDAQEHGDWMKRLPPAPEVVREKDDPHNLINCVQRISDSPVALSRILASVKYDTTAFVVVVSNSGSVTTWGEQNFDGERNEEWVSDRLRDAQNMLFGKPIDKVVKR